MIKHFLDNLRVVVYSCKKCGDLNYLTPAAFWSITDFGAKCEKCETINKIILEKGEFKKKVWSKIYLCSDCNQCVLTFS